MFELIGQFPGHNIGCSRPFPDNRDKLRTTCPNPDVNVNMRKETVKFSEVIFLEFLELMVEPNGAPVYHDLRPQVEPFSKFIKNEIKSETLSLMSY